MTIAREVAALSRMTVKQLLARYAEVFGDAANTKNRQWLLKRISWRLQANAEGDLSERARRRAAELANDADLRLTPPRVKTASHTPTVTLPLPAACDRRLPPPGTVLTRPYKGGVVQVQVLAEGFEHEGTMYTSLSAVAKAVTGSHMNGFTFFRLGGVA